MKISVYVLGRDMVVFEPVFNFKSVLTYHAGTGADDFVLLTMPVRTECDGWDDKLPPALQMNLPERYLFQVLQEQFGPHMGASPTALLSVVGRTMVDRLQVAAPGAKVDEPAKPLQVEEFLRGDIFEGAFAELVPQSQTSRFLGVVPKILDAHEETPTFVPNKQATRLTHRHMIKRSSGKPPFVALSEYLYMQVGARVMPAAKVEVLLGARALVVDRFDVDEDGEQFHRERLRQ